MLNNRDHLPMNFPQSPVSVSIYLTPPLSPGLNVKKLTMNALLPFSTEKGAEG